MPLSSSPLCLSLSSAPHTTDSNSLIESEALADAQLDADIAALEESMQDLALKIKSQQEALNLPMQAAPPPPAPPAIYKGNNTDEKPVTNYGNRESYPEKLKTNFTVYDTVTLSGVPVHDKKTLFNAMNSINVADKTMNKLHGLSTDVEFKN
jgi:hypothetical protein